MNTNINKVHFVGAGPGDKELITLKGYKLLSNADVVIYAGSLVNPALLEYCKESCEIHDSAYMKLQTGDFSIYGSIREQVEDLAKLNIDYDCTPGVSSFLGASSALGVEYTVPEVSQSVVITRMEGRTPVPPKESIESFAKHQTSMVIFLSVQEIEKVVEKLIAGGYPKTTPIEDIASKVKENDIKKTALIMVGEFLGTTYNNSKLYDKDFKHEYRK